MRITGRTKMKAYEKIQPILKLSDTDFQKEIKNFAVPQKIGFIPVTTLSDITIGQVFSIWDCKDDNELLKNTIKIFITNKWWKKIIYKLLYRNEINLPLIDFTRLVVYTGEVVKITSDLFQSCKTIKTDDRIDAILKKYKGSHQDVIAQFCNSYPSYTILQAMEVGWYDVYLCIKSRTTKTNIDIEISQLKPKEK